jgi:hypothetical protein
VLKRGPPSTQSAPPTPVGVRCAWACACASRLEYRVCMRAFLSALCSLSGEDAPLSVLSSLDSSSQYCAVLWVLCLFGGCPGGCLSHVCGGVCGRWLAFLRALFVRFYPALLSCVLACFALCSSLSLSLSLFGFSGLSPYGALSRSSLLGLTLILRVISRRTLSCSLILRVLGHSSLSIMTIYW